MGNVNSLPNKCEELEALIKTDRIYRECSLYCITETWLTDAVPDSVVNIPGFTILRADRQPEKCGKMKGGGLVLLVNDRWCRPGHITVKEKICCRDVELLAVSLRPYYVPREFSHIVAIIVYIQPRADPSVACDVIQDTVAGIQLQHSDALIAISGDYNHVDISSFVGGFTQYVNCHTRHNSILDLCYINVENAYTVCALPPLGKSDHNLIHLRSSYRPCVMRLPATIRSYRRWTPETSEALREEVRCFPNNKPWITSSIKHLLNQKREAFKAGDWERIRAAQRDLKKAIRQAKRDYKEKLEKKLQHNSTREVWKGMRVITGYKDNGEVTQGDVSLAKEFNHFYTVSCPAPFSGCATAAADSCLAEVPNRAYFSMEEVRAELRRLRPGKSAGPDGIPPRLLKDCAAELAVPLHTLFNWSLQTSQVPKQWKTSCIVPVPKGGRPSGVKDYRPVALTSVIMKTLERLLLRLLGPQLQQALDPLQFAYRANMGVEDAVLYLLHRALSFLDGTGGYVRLMFFDFSSAFNTIQPQILRGKLENLSMEPAFIEWIISYMTERPQYVRLGNTVSDTVETSIGVPQGTVLSPFLFTLYTSDFSYRTSACHIQKYSDDTVVAACVRRGDEEEYRRVISEFVTWSRCNGLILNTSKTKEMIVDFGRRKSHHPPVVIEGEGIEVVQTYKYLGVHLDHKLDWSVHVNAAYRKGQSRLFFLRKLKSFQVCNEMLYLFYQSVVASAVFFAVGCWGSCMTARDRNRLDKLVRKCVSVLGRRVDSVGDLLEGRMRSMMKSILRNRSHPLHDTVAAQQSSRSNRFLSMSCRTERFRRSFVPAAIRLHNGSD
ncbi:hypothetical protein PO909_032280 [Leuciscus waleckii]